MPHALFSPTRWLSALALAGLLHGAAQAQTLALVSSEKDNAITVIRLADLQLQAPIPTCKRPRHMQLSANRQQLLVACSDSAAADVIDLRSFAGLDSYADVRAHLVQAGNHVEFRQDGHMLRIEWTQLADLGSDDFLW